MNENKMLMKRVKDLELKADVNTMHNQQAQCYDLTSHYAKIVEDECGCKPGETSNVIISQNMKIDQV
jgi:hypothetical protein